MPRLFGVVIVVLFCYVSVASAVAASDRSHLSSDPQVNHARALIQRDQFDEALVVLRPLVSNHPDKTDVRFLFGLAAIGEAGLASTEEQKVVLLDEAISSLHAILIDRPELVRVRLELAHAFFLKGEDTLSREHFERVLAGKPPPAMAANIHRFLRVIQARRRWRAYFGVSIAPDTNINAASDAEFIYINGLPFRRSAVSRASSDVGVVGWGGGEYQYPLSDRLRLRAGVDVAHREYGGTAFDQTFVAGHVGPRWFVTKNTEVSLLAAASQRWLAGDPFSYDFGARFEVEHWFASRLTANGRASWHQRQYRVSTFLDGPLMVLSLGATSVLTPTVQTSALVGYSRQDSKSVVWRNAGLWTRLGVSVALPWGFTLGGSAELRWTNYEGRWAPFTADGASREDQTRIFQASVLNRAVTTFGFSPQLVLVNEARESNAQLYDYKRNRVELRFVRQF